MYEGGLKLWECTRDLMQFLESETAGPRAPHAHHAANPAGGGLPLDRVLDMGCGHGLAGIVALQCGADLVCFQDLNEEVILRTTAPNLVLNEGREALDRARFFCGDWDSLAITETGHTDNVGGGSGSGGGGSEGSGSGGCSGGGGARAPPMAFGLVLSCETIYTAETLLKVCTLLQRVLRKPDGVALVAAKRYYFGTGGGTVAFLDSLSKVSGGALGGSVAASFEDCQSNIREIVQVRWQGQGGEEGEGVVADGSGNGGVGGGYGGGETKT